MWRQREDTRNIVVIWRVLLLGEITNNVAASLVTFGEDVKEEWFDIIIKRFVVEKQFGKEAEVLAVDLVLLAVHFKDGQIVLTIDLIAWRVTQVAFQLVSHQGFLLLHVFETKLANE